jgi:archaeal flagellar protein FlaI
MIKKIAVCPECHTKITCEGEPGQKVTVECTQCKKKGVVAFAAHEVSLDEKNLVELDFYPVTEPFAYVKILKDTASLDKFYKIIEPQLTDVERTALNFIQETLMNSIDVMLNEIQKNKVEGYLTERIDRIIRDYEMKVDDVLKTKIMYYVKREFLRYGKIDPLMRDPNIEDISCDGSGLPIFLYHRKYGSVKSNIQFNDEVELSAFVVKLAQKCGKHISIAEPMLDATMPDGSRIQMTLSKAVTTHGSTFTIRKFRSDPITATDLILFKTMSPEMVAYMWLAVENGVNALIAGGTASGKTSTLNALSLFIPRESKIVSIEETREINLPHPNWIPGVVRSGFGEVINDKLAGEIDLYDLMKAALRQRPEYILVGEIRGKEAYVLFQAMATGHTTYSTVHADSTSSLIHRLEGKPIDIPRVMLQSLDIVTIQVQAQMGDQRVRRCKQIVEIVDIDPMTKEILTNEVFRWDPLDDQFYYSGKSYVLERIRGQYEMNKEEMMEELKRRVEILEWMKQNKVRAFKDVARMVATYAEAPEEFMDRIRKGSMIAQLPSLQPRTPMNEPPVEVQQIDKSSSLNNGLVINEEKPAVVTKKKKRLGFKRKDTNDAN